MATNSLKNHLNSDEAERMLRETVWHNSADGKFYWKKDMGKRRKKGDLAGTYHKDNGVTLCIDGVLFAGHRVAWLLAYGRWPTKVRHLDGDKTNNRIENLD